MGKRYHFSLKTPFSPELPPFINLSAMAWVN